MHPVRKCPICGQSDDAPRHVDDRNTGIPLPYHHDCHANAGCDVCTVLVAEAAGKQGDELRTHLVALPPRQWTHHESGAASFENVEG